MDTQCVYCHDLIPVTRKSKGTPTKYCSVICRNKAEQTRQGYVEQQTICEMCSKSFKFMTKAGRERLFCSLKCRRQSYQRVYATLNPNAGKISTGTVGAIGELAVGIDLLSKGCEVFRALSPACSCDLAVLYNRRVFRIEVRTAFLTKSGKLTFASAKAVEKFDILALVYNNAQLIEYRPPLKELFGIEEKKEN